MKIKVLTSLLAIVAILAVGCHTEPTPDKPDKPTPTDGVVFTANYFDCEYYGDYYTPNIGNYYIHLSDNGFTESGYARPNSTYYRLDLYSDLYDDAEGGALRLPVGTYTLDTEDTLAHGTFSVAWSKYLRSDAEGEFSEELSFEAGELRVTESGAQLKVSIAGKEHIVTYEGEMLVADKRIDDGDNDDRPEGILSTLTEDKRALLDQHEMVYVNYGDYYSTGLNNWTFAIWPLERIGDHIQFDILSESGESIFGSYTIGDEATPFSFLRGTIEGDDEMGYMAGSWYYTDDGYSMAPFVDGVLTISDAGNGEAKIEFDTKDDAGNRVTGSWQGVMQEMQQ